MRQKSLIVVACLIAFFSTVGAALPYPILAPLFAADAANQLNHFWGLPPKLLLGIALAVNPVGLLIGATILGPLSDRFGRRPIILTSASAAALGHAVTAIALVIESYPLFIAARFATGLMEGNDSVARAMLAEQLSGEERVRALSWLNGALYMGWVAGPLIAALTVGWGVTVPFWIAAVALLVTAVLAAIAVPKELAKAHPESQALTWQEVIQEKNALHLLKHRDIQRLFFIQLCLACGVTGFYEFFPLWLVEYADFTAQGIAWATAGLCLAMTISSIAAGRVTLAQPLKTASIYAAIIAFCLAILVIRDPRIGLVVIIALGIPNAIYNAVMPAWCAEKFGNLGQGAVMGLLSTVFCLANILMALAGAVLTLIDTRLIFVLGALLAAIASRRILLWHRDLQTSDDPGTT
jgi:MFS transporter, DHA1 family, tetracycline resistance protein